MRHKRSIDCECHPTVRDVNVVLHNAKDIREARERLGMDAHKNWIVEFEKRPPRN